MDEARATFAAGCFWGAEAAFRRLPGVRDARVGWTGGEGPAPDAGGRCHAEAVEVAYEPATLPYAALVEAFLALHDPTDLAAAGADGCGLERSAIYVADAAEEAAAHAALAREAARRGVPLATQVAPSGPFIQAPDADQRYVERHGAACRLPG